MNLRLFFCPSCGHQMRLSGERCGRCFRQKPVRYSTEFLAFSVSMVLLMTAAVTAYVAISNAAI